MRNKAENGQVFYFDFVLVMTERFLEIIPDPDRIAVARCGAFAGGGKNNCA